MRRRRLIFRSVVLVLAVVCAVLLVTPFSLGGGVVAIGLGVLAVVELSGLVGVLRDRAPDHPPRGAWWWCELPVDHRFVRLASDDATWRCRRCGDVQHTPPGTISDAAAKGEGGFNIHFNG
ncbi:hypothetical protein [Cellulomonas xylanilytica]|uniref:Uncharacterized protein n=1 Tax=Cellulomonas xylanilytica TaxID=233583 RepID=A0A510V6A0_9CELL|nr:hypothetical protein [Cellulomonas xylanilytica]GEK22398.1 hypothetical protein CXY01_29180 [Cellulomonas xylanilytica]